ncbi:DUF262 domain-containing protein [Clostridium sp. SM-530-WT-3G]|uniref:GmrSD restriction endonuclease domain-containing protein n=1 Tax=Clostridium sp. SM-530-WT-3G TaxID=2725303 RepID=UPI00145E09B1|nr:DUF262 domain-containing protein [Clostridium sp. SM-530-WT-3G]NME81885.1 DUF262 domain-containing protein [Clostridium sp. SM-530-WT-3G]
MNNDGVKYITLSEFIKNKFIIPAFQRNYVWSKENAKTVIRKMLKGWNDKKGKDTTLGMITLFKLEDSERYEIIDGQQRIITIKLLLQWLNYCLEEDKRVEIDLQFGRDKKCEDNNKRINYIENLIPNRDFFEDDCNSIDTIRFCRNYNAIGDIILDDNQKTIKDTVKDEDSETINSLIEKIFSLKLIVHITSENPNAEFLNINSKKNRFSLADYAKSYMIINEDKKKRDINSVVMLYKNLSKNLYKDQYWSFLKMNYEEDMENLKRSMDNGVENRMDCVFIDRYGYDKKDISDLIDSTDEELVKLNIINKRIKEVFNSTSTYNSFLWMAKNKKRKFFDLILCENDYIKDKINIEKIFIKEASKLSNIEELNSFLEIQLVFNKLQCNDNDLKIIEYASRNNDDYYGELLEVKDVQDKLIQQYSSEEV